MGLLPGPRYTVGRGGRASEQPGNGTGHGERFDLRILRKRAGALAIVELNRSQQMCFRFAEIAAEKAGLPLNVVRPALDDSATPRRTSLERAVGKFARTVQVSAGQRHRP